MKSRSTSTPEREGVSSQVERATSRAGRVEPSPVRSAFIRTERRKNRGVDSRGRSPRLKKTVLFLTAVALLAVASSADANELRPYRLSIGYGLGGSIDSELDTGLDNGTFQLGFSFEIEADTLVGLRAGQLGLDAGYEDAPGVDTADMSYLTVAGEYRFNEGYHTSGIYLGVGVYQLSTTGLIEDDDTSIGVAFGVTGEFDVSKAVAIGVELSAHWADLAPASFLTMGHVGLVFRF